MNYKIIKIKEGITLHTIETNKFKTNLLSIFLTTPLERENVTLNALIPAVLRRGTANINTQEEISKKLEEMYGASFDCGIEKTGDNHVIKFYLETINDEFLPQKEDILQNGINTILEIALNPLAQENSFNTEYVKSEKDNLKRIIEGKADNKAKYALDRCIEEMYKGKPYGLYRYGYVEDLDKIDSNNLYEYYKKLINECKIDIFASGDINAEELKEIINQNENIKKLNDRKAKFIVNNEETEVKQIEEPKVVTESMDVTQGKLNLGIDILNTKPETKFAASLYNGILGGTATSKLFQNVREKAHLAYVAGSNYLRQKNNIFIRCGIEIENYEKALDIIKKQIEDMKKGDFTEEDINSAKSSIISTIKFIPDEQDTQITYYFGQELSNSKLTIEEYIEKINNVSKEEILDIANNVQINTIYFLKN